MRGSATYEHLWGTDELRAVFDDRGRIEAWLGILAALAAAQADVGLLPKAAAREIAERARVDLLDLAYVAEQTRATQHSTLGLIRGMQRILSPEAGEWFCYGATVQDVSDTWNGLVMRTVGAIAYRDLRAIEGSLLRGARKYRDTPVAARTHGQPGLPITFGFKLAVIASEVRRHIERLKDGRDRWLVGQLGGAAGTASFWGDKAFVLQERFCRRLGLRAPDIAWLTARDRLVEFAAVLAMVAQTLGKLGNEVVELQRPELGEAFEPFTPGQVGSITMPHKRNPERSEHLVTLARLIQADLATLLGSMVVEHERDGRAWKAEWAAFPDLCLLAGASLSFAREVAAGLRPDPAAMRRNLEAELGYVLSERVMLELAGRVGKQSAHRIVYEAAMAGRDRGADFRVALESSPEASAMLTAEDLDRLLDLSTAARTAAGFVERVVALGGEARRTERSGWS